MDLQVEFLRETSLVNLGGWVSRRAKHCEGKRLAADNVLGKLVVMDEELEREWTAQVFAQTRPLARATGKLARDGVKAILTLMDLVGTLRGDIRTIESRILADGDDMDGLMETRAQLAQRVADVEAQIASKRRAMGVGGEVNLKALMKDRYLQQRLKTLAVKERLRAKLQGRKFEFERVDKAYNHASANGTYTCISPHVPILIWDSDAKLDSHIKSQIGRHQSSISSLHAKFNKMCDELQALIDGGRAPPGTISPRKIPKEGMYTLDVDSAIWDDSGLNDGDAGPVPRWMADVEVRKGIVAWLTSQRCNEELARLQTECVNLRMWAKRQWDDLQRARLECGESSFVKE